MRRSAGQAASVVAVLAVVGVGGAAVLAGSEPAGDTPGATDPGRTDTTDRAGREDRTAPSFSAAAALAPVEAGLLRGRLLLSDPTCRLVTVPLARPAVSEAGDGCLVTSSPSSRFALLRDEPGGPGHVVDLRSGRAAATPVRLGAERTPTVDDEGAVHRCSNGFSETLRFGRANPSRRPGCLPIRLGGRSYLVPAPESAPLQLEDATGRALLLDRTAPPGAPPYVLGAPPDGRFLAVASADARGDALVALYRVRDGAVVGRWHLGDDTEALALRVARHGAAVAALVRERRRPRDSWRLLRPADPTPVAGVGGERLRDVAFAPDGRHVAAVTEVGGTAVVLDTAGFAPLGRLPADGMEALMWVG